LPYSTAAAAAAGAAVAAAMLQCSTPGEQTCNARFRVRQLRVAVLVRPNTEVPLAI